MKDEASYICDSCGDEIVLPSRRGQVMATHRRSRSRWHLGSRTNDRLSGNALVVIQGSGNVIESSGGRN